MKTKRAHNFSAGPAALPSAVMERVEAELLNYKGSGTSIMELSHRGEQFLSVYKSSIELLQRLANIPEHFDILYMTGGASTQFALVPMNLSAPNRIAGYLNSGAWSQKAIAQARLQKLQVHISGSSEGNGFRSIPDNIDPIDGMDYMHITSNNTIYGTRFQKLPDPGETKLVIDSSSDFLAAPIDWKKIGLLYAGAQKNAGPAGLTIVVIDREYYKREKENIPTIFRYSTYAKGESMYNTPPTFQIYVFEMILRWIESMGGLEQIDLYNRQKAALLYEIIDAYPKFFIGYAEPQDRSFMNVTWNFPSKELEVAFLVGAAKREMIGLKGHRSVGGLRASIYNGVSLESCQALADYMRQFQREQG